MTSVVGIAKLAAADVAALKRSKVESACHRKAMFQTTLRAEAVAKRRMAKGAPPLRVYQCPVCDLYHLTSKVRKKGEAA